MNTIHKQPHPLAGMTVKIKADVKHPQQPNFGGSEFRVEDWWDRVAGKSWAICQGNPACLVYAIRSAMARPPINIDDEVVYGKVGHFGHLVHISELDDNVAASLNRDVGSTAA